MTPLAPLELHKHNRPLLLARGLLLGGLLAGLVSCVSPSEQFLNSAAPNRAELRTKSDNLLSSAYGRGVILMVLDIDGKTVMGVRPPYLLSPGNHTLAVRASGSYYAEAQDFLSFTFKPNSKYVLRGRNLGGVMHIQLVNTTGTQEIVEDTRRILAHRAAGPIYVPIMVGN
jgi:hypothetical protein